jgi:DNA-directed RNA polymerase specialized sigma24 family protein
VSPWPTDLRESNANGSATVGQKRAMPFTTTHWSVVLEAQTESPAAQEALEKLCRIYWRPIYSFVQRQGIGPEEAKDVTQAFFADLLERGSLTAVRKEKGRFRSYLLGALKHFLADERRRAMAIKRGRGQQLIPLEELSATNGLNLQTPSLPSKFTNGVGLLRC